MNGKRQKIHIEIPLEFFRTSNTKQTEGINKHRVLPSISSGQSMTREEQSLSHSATPVENSERLAAPPKRPRNKMGTTQLPELYMHGTVMGPGGVPHPYSPKHSPQILKINHRQYGTESPTVAAKLSPRGSHGNQRSLACPVLRGYVVENGQAQANTTRTVPEATLVNKLPNRGGRRVNKYKELPRRSRSECNVRPEEPKSQRVHHLVALDAQHRTKPLITLKSDFCLVHNAVLECTCTTRQQNHHHHHKTLPGDQSLSPPALCTQCPTPATGEILSKSKQGDVSNRAEISAGHLRDRLRIAASRLSGNEAPMMTERERMFSERDQLISEVIQSRLTHRERIPPLYTTHNGKTPMTSNEKATLYTNGRLPMGKSQPPALRANSRMYINTWLEAGASIPKFIDYKPDQNS